MGFGEHTIKGGYVGPKAVDGHRRVNMTRYIHGAFLYDTEFSSANNIPGTARLHVVICLHSCAGGWAQNATDISVIFAMRPSR